MLAERDLELDVMTEINAKSDERVHTTPTGCLCESKGQACARMLMARSVLHSQSKLVEGDAPVTTPICVLLAQYPAYGYRRIQIFLEQ